MTHTLKTNDGTNYSCTCGWVGHHISTWIKESKPGLLFCGGCKLASLPRRPRTNLPPATSPTNTMAKPQPPNSVSPVSREVIESKLLDALEDEGTTAVLFSEADLKVAIVALSEFAKSATGDDETRARSLSLGMAQLYQEAFA